MGEMDASRLTVEDLVRVPDRAQAKITVDEIVRAPAGCDRVVARPGVLDESACDHQVA
jgi:hypothetical protein